MLLGIKGNEGCVINRERGYTYSTYCLDDTNWYIVQVNIDYDMPIPRPQVDRRTPAQNKLNSIGPQGVSEEFIFTEILALYPNKNYLTI